MKVPAPVEQTASSFPDSAARQPKHRHLWIKWGAVIASGLTIASIPPPTGLTPQSWRLLAIFLATIAGCIVQPIPGAAMVLLGVSAAALFGALPVAQALGGYADPIVWMVLAAFFISRGMIKTGLGRRIAFLFIRALGHRSLGLGYALVCTDMVLASSLQRRTFRRHYLSNHQEPCRSLRFQARANGTKTRGISHHARLPV
jgi:divalent anion:Na+ symporter, DASS family